MNVESLEIDLEGNKYEGGKDHLIFQGQGGNHFSFSFFFLLGSKPFLFVYVSSLGPLTYGPDTSGP